VAITDMGPVVMHEGAGMNRQGSTSTPRRPQARRPGIRRLKARRPAKKAPRAKTRGGRTVQDSENNPNVAGYHTAAVDAPLGYQGMFGAK
jgi:hypothetical protein